MTAFLDVFFGLEPTFPIPKASGCTAGTGSTECAAFALVLSCCMLPRPFVKSTIGNHRLTNGARISIHTGSRRRGEGEEGPGTQHRVQSAGAILEHWLFAGSQSVGSSAAAASAASRRDEMSEEARPLG